LFSLVFAYATPLFLLTVNSFNFVLQYALVVFEVGGGARDEEALELLTAVNRKIPPTSDSKAALAALSMSKGDR
jgi:hypothetical protein